MYQAQWPAPARVSAPKSSIQSLLRIRPKREGCVHVWAGLRSWGGAHRVRLGRGRPLAGWRSRTGWCRRRRRTGTGWAVRGRGWWTGPGGSSRPCAGRSGAGRCRALPVRRGCEGGGGGVGRRAGAAGGGWGLEGPQRRRERGDWRGEGRGQRLVDIITCKLSMIVYNPKHQILNCKQPHNKPIFNHKINITYWS